MLVLIALTCAIQPNTSLKNEIYKSTDSPYYMQSFYLQFRVYAIQKWSFFLEPILLYTVILGLFICKFVLFEPIFFSLAYHEVHLYRMC